MIKHKDCVKILHMSICDSEPPDRPDRSCLPPIPSVRIWYICENYAGDRQSVSISDFETNIPVVGEYWTIDKSGYDISFRDKRGSMSI